jgi:predicted DNA-binding transcriptional regulator AlpA
LLNGFLAEGLSMRALIFWTGIHGIPDTIFRQNVPLTDFDGEEKVPLKRESGFFETEYSAWLTTRRNNKKNLRLPEGRAKALSSRNQIWQSSALPNQTS